jgi:Anti-sigma-K factor rskA
LLSSVQFPMQQDDPGLEQRLSRFEAQLDRFSLAFHQWRETKGRADAPGPSDLDQRMRALEEAVTREAHALRQIHEEPLKLLQAQAESLADLSRSLQALVADLRLTAATSVPGQNSTVSWPLERVVHLHDELRRANVESGVPLAQTLTADSTEPSSRRVHLLPAGSDSTTVPAAESVRRTFPRWRFVSGALAISFVIFLTIVAVGRIEGRLNDAAARVAVAEQQVMATTQQANREVAAARQDADRQIAEARQVAQRAETVGAILTAPDLRRFNLTSAESVGPSAQVLWSRTRGLVLSGSRLPAAPPKSTYQLWLVTGTQSVGAGLFVPDDAGRATLVVDAPPRVPGAVVGAAITVEPSGGRSTPSGRTLLARFP